MRKFFKFGLVVVIAVSSIGLLAYGFLRESTDRARDASVSALWGELARLKEEREADVERTVAKNPSYSQSKPDTVVDIVAYRERWATLLGSLDNAMDGCESDTVKSTRIAAGNIVFGSRGEPLTQEERGVISSYSDCTRGSREELLRLCDESVHVSAFYTDTSGGHAFELFEGFWRAENYLRGQLMYSAAMQDYGDSMEIFGALLNISRLRTRHHTQWNIDPRWVWPIIHDALKSGEVDDRIWEAILERLAACRMQQSFVDEIMFYSESMTASSGAWAGSEQRLSENPISYRLNRAYSHIAAPFYNYDIDRYSQAMRVLVDLARKPYCDIVPALEQFYDDFDVEPSAEGVKFTRSTSRWRYVIGLSRIGFIREAHEQASIDIVRIAILLERYQQKTGSYPDSLKAITDLLGGKVPTNPINGTSYIFELVGDSFRLGYQYPEFPELVETYNHNPIKVELWPNIVEETPSNRSNGSIYGVDPNSIAQ